MEPVEGRQRRNHVINKIKRISSQIERKEFWNYLILVALFGVLVCGLLYYIFL